MAGPIPPIVPVIGHNHTIDDFYCFTEPEIKELYNGVIEIAKLGQPPEIPVQIPMGQLIRMGKTINDYRKLAQALVSALQANPRNEEAVNAAMANMSTLINLPAPSTKPKSRLVLG